MTKAQAKKRLKEAKTKVMNVYVSQQFLGAVVSTQDMVAIEKVLDKCIKRLN